MVGSIGIAELLARADAGEDLVLLDVRNDEEFGAWRFEARKPVETVHVPYFDFLEDPEGASAKVPADRQVVVLCAKGGSSEMVAELLEGAGRRARNVEGGMVAYGEHLQALRVPTDRAEGLEIWQLNRRGKGCLSYVLRSGDEAVVVDPSRRTTAHRNLGARIVRVIDTHVHADHLSGGAELAASAGAPYSVDQGDETIRFGAATIRVLASPGHTPGSVMLLAGDHYLLSGDTLFVAGVGRPDLGGKAAAWARDLFATLRDRIGPLPDDTVVLPAHFASVAEIGEGGIVSVRLGDLRHRAPEMKIRDERSFVDAMVAAVSKPPAAYEHIVRANLGLESAPEEQMTEWELGKNQCAASAGAAANRPGA